MEREDYILDVTGVPGEAGPPDDRAGAAGAKGRPFISVHFECCNVYQRVYRDAEASAYVGFCPRCGGKVVVGVGPEGVNTRFFRAR